MVLSLMSHERAWTLFFSFPSRGIIFDAILFLTFFFFLAYGGRKGQISRPALGSQWAPAICASATPTCWNDLFGNIMFSRALLQHIRRGGCVG